MGDFFTRLYFAASGLVYYGGLLGALAAIMIYTKKKFIPARPYLNIFVLVFPLFHGIGRIGCVFAGCCYGIEYHGFGAIHYPASVVVHGINDDITAFSRFPVQPMEALIEFIIFAVLLVIYLKKGDSITIAPIYLLSYAVIRFLDEFLRGDEQRGIWGPFSTSQWIALIIIAAVLTYYIIRKNFLSNKDQATT